MEPATAVVPPHVAGPLRLSPFLAVRLAASRVADRGLSRTFARPYRAVPDRLAAWERRGLVTRDASPALYLHEYTTGGVTIRGMVGLLDISRRAHHTEDRAVLPHEAVYPAQADDLADRMARMRLNPAPILLVQHSPPELRAILVEVRRRLPEHQFVDRAGSAHRLWAVRDTTTLTAVATFLAPTTCLIADGHHRYAAYLRLHQRDQAAATRSGLAMLVDHDDTPLRLGPIHRLLAGTTYDDLVAAAVGTGWVVRPSTAPGPPPTPDVDGRLVVTDGRRSSVVELPDQGGRTTVEALHHDLVPALSYGPTKVTYHHVAEDALAAAAAGGGVAVLLPPPDLDRVLATARAGRLLPEKATSFQPKPPLGVLIRELRAG